MANNMQTKYTIEMNVKGADKTNATIKGIEYSLNDISQNASKLDFKETLKGVSDVEKTFKSLLNSEEDATKEMEALTRNAGRAFEELEKQAVKLNYSLSEQGKLQRQRIKELQDEREKLGKTADEKKRGREIDKEINALLKNVVNASDDELKVMVAQNREARVRLKLVQQESRAYKSQQTVWKSLARIVKDDNKTWREKIKAVAEYAKSLKVSEGALKRVSSIGKKLGGAAKVAGIGLGVAGAVGGLLVGGAIDYAKTQADKEKEARRIKGGTSEDNINLIDALYMATGRDAASIVDAINRVRSVLGNISYSDTISATQAELEYPGTAALLRQQNVGNLSVKDFEQARYKQRELQKATGLSTDQMSDAHNYIRNMKQSRFQNASLLDVETVYGMLKGSGAYDSDEELNKAFDRFMRAQAASGKNIFDFASKYDWTKGVVGNQNRQQASQAISLLDWEMGRQAAYSTGEVQKSSAEKILETARRFEMVKNKFLAKLIEVLEPLVDKLEEALTPEVIDKVTTGLVDFIAKVIPKIGSLIETVMEFMPYLIDGFNAIVGYIKRLTGDRTLEKKNADTGWLKREMEARGINRADGGIVGLPSLCGEAGPEAVIPLSYERSGRGAQILQQVEQHFNMSGSETTAASLASMIGTNAFAFESGRLGRLARRRGI